MRTSDLAGGDYVEPFAGGAGVAIDLLLGKVAGKIHLNDLCKPVYAFWRSILNHTEDFCRRISRASLTIDEWKRQRHTLKHPRGVAQLDLGFSFFYLNRCNRSGIPSGGVIGGLDQTGEWKIDARFPRNELIHRIEAIAAKRDCISVKNLDAKVYLTEYCNSLPKTSLVYCDPPYYHKADRLYLNHYEPEDHAEIARTIQKRVKLPWIVSYDNAPEVVEHYAGCKSFVYDLQYNVAKVYKGREVFFFSNKVTLPKASCIACIDSALKGYPGASRKRTRA
jgi:DNA adenine methylase